MDHFVTYRYLLIWIYVTRHAQIHAFFCYLLTPYIGERILTPLLILSAIWQPCWHLVDLNYWHSAWPNIREKKLHFNSDFILAISSYALGISYHFHRIFAYIICSHFSGVDSQTFAKMRQMDTPANIHIHVCKVRRLWHSKDIFSLFLR